MPKIAWLVPTQGFSEKVTCTKSSSERGRYVPQELRRYLHAGTQVTETVRVARRGGAARTAQYLQGGGARAWSRGAAEGEARGSE